MGGPIFWLWIICLWSLPMIASGIIATRRGLSVPGHVVLALFFGLFGTIVTAIAGLVPVISGPVERQEATRQPVKIPAARDQAAGARTRAATQKNRSATPP